MTMACWPACGEKDGFWIVKSPRVELGLASWSLVRTRMISPASL
jgi:hypothetical protein